MNEKWILQIYSLLFSALVAVSAMAGVSSVGNGGGLSEMHFLYFLQNSKPFLISLQKHEVVQGSVSLQKEMSELLKKLSFIQKEHRVTFSSDLGDQPFHMTSEEISVASQLLYDGEMPRPLPLVISRALTLQMVLALKQSERYFEYVQVFDQMLQGLKFEHELTPFGFSSTLLRVSDLRFEWENRKQRILSLEDVEHTYDLSELLQEALPCGQSGDWIFQNWKTYYQNQKRFFHADAQGQCGQGHFEEGKIEIRFELDEKGSVKPDLLQIRFLIDL